MKIAVYGIQIPDKYLTAIEKCLCELIDNDTTVFIHENLKESLGKVSYTSTFSSKDILSESDLVLSIGGDGTILDVVELVQSNEIPVLGINTGRLGFLSNVSIEEIPKATEAILKGELRIEKRTLIELVDPKGFFDFNLGLNEITIHKKDSSSMITVHTQIENEYFSTYWADGLILSTPTGSTGYSLSCGGPIVTPGSGNFILTPIAPHNLNVRPLIIPDHDEVKLTFEGRSEEFLLSIDSRNASVTSDTELIIRKANYHFHLARLNNHSFSRTLKSKLMWGMDRRNS